MCSPSNTDSYPFKAPSEFYCPLTMEIMRDPMMNRSGVSYDRAAIFSWLKHNGNICPVTYKPLEFCDLISNRALQARIKAWCRVHHLDGTDNYVDTSERDDSQREEIFTCLATYFEQEKNIAVNEPHCVAAVTVTSARPGRGGGRMGFLKRLNSGRSRK